MSRPAIALPGAAIQVYINNKLYKEAQTVSYTIDAGESEIYGIDSPFPQEIHSTRSMVSGNISGIRVRLSGGLQAYEARPLVTDLVKAEYISIRIVDRATKEDILFIPSAKISRQNFQAQAKGMVRISFDFRGLVGFEPLDRV